MNQRKTLEIMWVNLKVGEKVREKAFMEELKHLSQEQLYNY